MSVPRLLAFDVESATISDEFLSPFLHDDIGITCAATLDTTTLLTWHGLEDGNPAPRMIREEAGYLVNYLLHCVRQGFHIVTWNGSGYDFPLLAQTSGRYDDCAFINRNHIDMMYLVVSTNGHRLGIKAPAKALGFQKGTKDVASGGSAPQMWADGEYEKVLEYVAQDAILTYQVAEALFSQWGFPWISSKGRSQHFYLPSDKDSSDISALSVEAVMKWPDPRKPKWMDRIERRGRYTDWMASWPSREE